MHMQKLTAPLLRELIDHIDVFETEGTGKDRTEIGITKKSSHKACSIYKY